VRLRPATETLTEEDKPRASRAFTHGNGALLALP